MYKKHLVESLKDYKRKESEIETTLARVEAYDKALENPKSFIEIYPNSSPELGTIKGKGGKPSSPVEKSIENSENNREETTKTLKTWIEEDLSRIYPLQIEKEQIDGALNALTKEQRYIIDLKYFEKMIWRDVEYNFNKKFGKNINARQLQNRNDIALKSLCKILSPYYEKMSI